MNIFSSNYANNYDQLYVEKNYLQECNQIEKMITTFSKNKPVELLDIGCGTGGHAIELAQRGYKVTGVDRSPAMIKLAQEKMLQKKLAAPIVWDCNDIRNFTLNKQFDVAIMMFAVACYLTSNEDIVEGLKNIRKHMKVGSILIFDFWYGPAVLAIRPTERIRTIPKSNGKVIRAAATELDTRHHLAKVKFHLWNIENNQLTSETEEVHSMRYFFPLEIELILQNAGFKMKRLGGFPEIDQELTDSTWNATAVAEAF